MQIYNLFLNCTSYNKKSAEIYKYFNTYFTNVVQEGIEPPTFALWVHYSNRWVTRPNWTCTRNRTLTKSLEEICAICYTIQAFCTDNRIRAYNLVLMRDLFFHLNYIGINRLLYLSFKCINNLSMGNKTVTGVLLSGNAPPSLSWKPNVLTFKLQEL